MTTNQPGGGSAFPLHGHDADRYDTDPGMTLLQYFAGQAIGPLITLDGETGRLWVDSAADSAAVAALYASELIKACRLQAKADEANEPAGDEYAPRWRDWIPEAMRDRLFVGKMNSGVEVAMGHYWLGTETSGMKFYGPIEEAPK